MSWETKNPINIIPSGGDDTQSGFNKIIAEFINLYSIISGLFSPATGHGHTGAINDGKQIGTNGIEDKAITAEKLADGVITGITYDQLSSALQLIIPPPSVPMPIYNATFTEKHPVIGGVTYTNWWLCDGTNGTPDLRKRMILGASADYPANSTGGEETHTLTINEMPEHDHTYEHRLVGSGTAERGWDSQYSGQMYTNNTSKTGGGQAHNNMPPYFALAYIMRIA